MMMIKMSKAQTIQRYIIINVFRRIGDLASKHTKPDARQRNAERKETLASVHQIVSLFFSFLLISF